MIIQGVTLTGVTVVDVRYVTANLQYYLDAGRTTSYSGSGTSINNISNTAIAASTLANGPVFTSAGDNSYFTFDGGDDALYTPSMISLFNSPVNNNLTLEAWVYTTTDNGVVVSEQGASPINSGWHDSQIEIVSGNLRVSVWTPSGISPLTVGAVTRNQWQQYVLTYDTASSTLRGYINGTTTANLTGVSRDSPQEGFAAQLYYALMYADGTSLGDGTSLAGRWSIFRVYNRALSAAEVLQNYNAEVSRYQ